MKRERDEVHIINLCDELLGSQASRQHRFEFLRGDTGRTLPCDAYYPDLDLVVEYREQQHGMEVPFFDRRITVSGVPRGQQRALYDQRRREVLPKYGITLIEINCSDFELTGKKRLRRVLADRVALRRRLARWVNKR